MTKLYQLVGLLIFTCPVNVLAQQPVINFTATPEQCVALHKGQTCYQDVLFQLQTPATGRFCLIESKNRQQLTCWDGQSLQQYQYSFESDATKAFSLIRHDDLQPLAEVKVTVTWVYKAPKQSPSGWRLF